MRRMGRAGLADAIAMESIDMASGSVEVSGLEGGSGSTTRTYDVRPVGASVQELWLCGGLEGYILKSIQAEA